MSRWIKSVAGGAALWVWLGMSAVQAQVPQVKTQVPGYYRMALGDFEVTALYDGEIKLDTKMLQSASPGEIRQRLAETFRENPTATAVNGFLINTGSRLVLVDAGAAKLFGPTLGNLLANLKASGYDPAQVDTILITHLHGDHIGGVLTPEGQIAFPKATVYVGKADADFWLSPEQMAKAPEAARGFFKMAQDSVAPYLKEGRLKTFNTAAELAPGIKPVNENGHTPGHSGYLIESKGKKLLVWGDVVHNAAVQLPHPEVTIEFDTDPKRARTARLGLFKWLAKDTVLVGAAHHAFPGLGHVRFDGQGHYSWVPVDFTPMPTP